MEPTSNTPEFQRKRLSLGLKVLIGFAVLLFLAVVGIAFWRSSLVSKNAAQLKAITDAGEPASARQLDSWYMHLEDKENAALVWLDGFAKLFPKPRSGQLSGWSRLDLPPRGKRFDQAQSEEATKLIARNAEALALFHRASAMPRSRYPTDLSQGDMALLPHLAPLKSSAQLLQIDALLHAQQGHGPEAAKALGDMLGAGRSLTQEPLLISQLVRAALNGLAFSATERVLHLTPLADQDLAQLQTAFARADDSNAFPRALIGERAMMIAVIESPNSISMTLGDPATDGVANNLLKRVGAPIARLTGFFQRDLGFYLDAMATNLAIAKLPYPQKFMTRTNLDSINLRAEQGLYVLSSLLLPAMAGTIAKDTAQSAHLRVAQAALAIERYRLANDGRIPDSLSTLVPKYLSSVPADPFDGAPLRFKPRGSGYVVYSIGLDGTDDGGQERQVRGRNSVNRSHDITFIMEK